MKKLFLPVILILIGLTSTNFSQEISADKKAVIDEVIAVTKAEENMGKTMSAMFEQMDAIYPTIVESMINGRENLTASQKEEIKKAILAKTGDFNKRFNQKFIQSIDFPVLIKNVYYPLYDKFFTTEELKDLAAFYKSPTGRKFNEMIPQFSAESVRLTQIYLLPKIDEIMKGIIEEDIKNNSKMPPPPARKEN